MSGRYQNGIHASAFAEPGVGVDPRSPFNSELFSIDSSAGKASIRVSCSWRFARTTKAADASAHFLSLDLLLKLIDPGEADLLNGKDHGEHGIPDATGTALETLVRTCRLTTARGGQHEAVTKVMLATRTGYLCRDDILEVRARHSRHIDSIVHFTAPGRRYPGVRSRSHESLLGLLTSSIGAFTAKRSVDPPWEVLRQLDADLRLRFSFQCILPTKPISRTVAVLGGRPAFDIERGSYGSRGPFEAAQALGISLTVLDRAGHWLEGDAYSYLREDFIVIDPTNEATLPAEIAALLENRRIDGVVTFSDEYVIATAKVAELLNLPSEPVKAVLQAHYKDETRALVETPSVQVLRLDDQIQLNNPSIAGQIEEMRYPLIIKPCRGGASRGVMRVNSLADIYEAVQRMDRDGLTKHGILLETYIDGPEVDANFVLWDGELLFCEISDDFPCQADSKDATIADNFVETLMVLPSRLRHEEIEVLKTSLHHDLLQLGFRSGVFHVEARVQNSSMSYREKNGLLDLAETEVLTHEQPEAFLVEVNVRPPGLDCAFSTLDTYGVDFCGLHLLRALDDRERFRALTKPFTSLSQYWCGNCQIPIHRDSILVTHDFFEKVIERLPDIASHVTRAEFFVHPGNLVSPVRGVGFVAYFLLYSRQSRRHVLEMSARVQEVSKAVLDGF